MELKGELKRNGLPSLFRNFASENFHGLLTITSSVGEKLITLTEHEVTVYCDELNEASRLGNILLGRNLITEELLDGALRDQKKLEPRPKLGDLLVQRKLVSDKAISDARRFQIEEDICDILSWKKATFYFAGANAMREIHPEDFAFDQVHRMQIDPDSFCKYVAKVTEDWDAIGDRLPTQYLCFKVSPKAADVLSTLSKENQRVLRFLKEGRSVEGTVKQSCIGRIQVCVHVIELLEKGLLLPASGSDLRYMASEHRAQKRYHDALYIYRRLLESPDARDEQDYFNNLIEEITETIFRLKQSGQYGEEAIVVSHKVAKDKYVQSQRNRNVFWIVFGAAAAFALAYILIQVYKPAEDVPQRYRETITRVDQYIDSGKFNDAERELDAFLDAVPDKSSHVGNLILERKKRIPDQLYNYIQSKVPPLIEQLKMGGEKRDEAVRELRRLLDEYPQNNSAAMIREKIAPYTTARVTEPKIIGPDETQPRPPAPLEELVELKRKADGNVQAKRYTEALRDLNTITRQAPAASDLYKQSDASVKAIQEVERSLNEQVKQAETAWSENKGDKAVEIVDRAIPLFGDLEGLPNAEGLKARWLSAKITAQQIMSVAKDLEDKGNYFEAKLKYEQVAVNYPQFPIAREARKKADAIQIICDALIKQITTALDYVTKGNFKKAREIYGPLLDHNSSLLVIQKVEIPVNVASIPSGSLVKLNGIAMGTTPRDVLIRAGEKYEITLERPGFSSLRIVSDKLTPADLNISRRLELDPIIIDFPAQNLQSAAPLLAPPIWFEDHLLVLNGADLVALTPPNQDPAWTVRNLFDLRTPTPESAPLDERNYWNNRLPPLSYKPGFLLLPLRNKQLLEIDVRTPAKAVTRSLFEKLGAQLPEIAGTLFVEEKSMLALKSILVAAFVDGQVRCFADFDKAAKSLDLRWSLPLDPQEPKRKDSLAAGLYPCKGRVWALSNSGMLQSFDPIKDHPIFQQQFSTMSPRSTFSSNPNDPLLALVQRNGKVTLYDLEHEQEIWSLPARLAMEESVGVLIDETGVFVTARKEDHGELSKYPRGADISGAAVKAEWSVKMDGYVNLDMARGKHLYLITNINKVYAYSKKDLSLLWEFKMRPELGEPKSIRAFGDYVYVLTDKGKVIILKSE